MASTPCGCWGEAPDIILLDIEMPRMDGFEFTKMIRAMPTQAHIPIIMITSRTAEKHRNRRTELGVDLYIGKPFQEEELLRNLREMLALASRSATRNARLPEARAARSIPHCPHFAFSLRFKVPGGCLPALVSRIRSAIAVKLTP